MWRGVGAESGQKRTFTDLTLFCNPMLSGVLRAKYEISEHACRCCVHYMRALPKSTQMLVPAKCSFPHRPGHDWSSQIAAQCNLVSIRAVAWIPWLVGPPSSTATIDEKPCDSKSSVSEPTIDSLMRRLPTKWASLVRQEASANESQL